MRYPESRQARRAAKHKAEQERIERAREAKQERREKERRVRSMTPEEVDDWLRRNGVSGGDRRKGDRRRS